MQDLVLICAVLAAVLSVADAGEPEDARALQGTWVPVQGEVGGKSMPEAVVKAIALKLSGEGYVVTVTGAPEPDEGTWKLDTAATPKGMTITGLKGPNAGKTFPAIYELTGDTLRICYDLSGVKRPEGFRTSPGTQLFLVTYRRKPG